MSAILVIVLGFLLVMVSTRGLDRTDARFVAGCFAFHVFSTFGQVWLHSSYYDVSDMHGYIAAGETLARLLEMDFEQTFPQLVRIALHLEPDLPFEIFGAGLSTGTLSALSGVIVFLVGSSMAAVCSVVATLACLGQIAMYKVARDVHPEPERPALRVGILLVPSVVFWSSALAKEAVALAFLGMLCASSYWLARGRIGHVLGVAFGGLGVALVKPYILFPFVLAAAAWFYAARRGAGGRRLSPAYLVLAAGAAIVGLALMGSLFPEYSLEKIGETTAMQQNIGAQAGGGSYVEIGNPEARSLSQQIPFVPLALMNAMFRPFLFEVRNPPMLAAAIETTALALLFVALVWQFRWAKVREAIASSPSLAFCITFTVTFGVAVGLASTNLGTLSRYRMPMMPFYTCAILLLRSRLKATHPGTAHGATVGRT